ncbi:LysR family transcriptional regulator [Novosphingobium kunmingense]|uniref:LysR family transcriptional regulator n=1 Tax=Novosphingobium kunmingense TaxID=1211806 RepID=A0A2N0HJM2_9SPHN|nr:LysR family transcriptional regulator [Novosphingobium kunmingense]PKB19118.1 LysR family transcriptional regulator [Novosphingobium kunmingense]
MFDWNDLKYFLAVARDGSTLAASRKLRVSQATVSRRIAFIEEQFGVELFSRAASGHALTARGEALVAHAEAVERAAGAFAEAVQSEQRRLSGTVRVTTVESAASAWVIPAIAGLHDNLPGVQVEIISTDENLDVARGEVDFAIRFGPMPEGETLVVRRLTELHECVYAERELVARLGRPETPEGLERYPLIVETSAPFDRFARWLTAAAPGGRIVQRVTSLSSVIAGVRAGIGAALLPTIIGDSLKGVVRVIPPIPELTTPCWMVTTDQARRQPHIRAVIDCVTDYVARSVQPLNEGGSVPSSLPGRTGTGD